MAGRGVVLLDTKRKFDRDCGSVVGAANTSFGGRRRRWCSICSVECASDFHRRSDISGRDEMNMNDLI